MGALLCPPVDDSCVTAVIFFNDVSYLGMCGHGTIGVVATLAYRNRIGAGTHRIETPVGVVVAHLDSDGQVEVANVPSYRLATNVTVESESAFYVVPTASVRIGWSQTWSRVGRRLFLFLEPKVRYSEEQFVPVVALVVGSGMGR